MLDCPSLLLLLPSATLACPCLLSPPAVEVFIPRPRCCGLLIARSLFCSPAHSLVHGCGHLLLALFIASSPAHTCVARTRARVCVCACERTSKKRTQYARGIAPQRNFIVSLQLKVLKAQAASRHSRVKKPKKCASCAKAALRECL